MILPEAEYKGAVKVLNNYRRNRRKIELLKDSYYNILESPNLDGLPRGNGVSDKVFSAVIKLNNDPAYIRAKAEIECVDLALLRCDSECKTIFDDYYYKQGQGKAKMIEIVFIDQKMSRRTFYRRKNELITAVAEEIKNTNWHFFGTFQQ